MYDHAEFKLGASVKKLGHVESKLGDFDRLNFHAKCKVKIKKSMKSYDHSKPKM